jgi:hypothetical protein
MGKIKKYEIPIDFSVVEMPAQSTILSIQLQGHALTAWALVPDNKPMIKRHFKIFSTGDDVPDAEKSKYITTVQDGIYVWHVFELN